jgi:hypothetical protein
LPDAAATAAAEFWRQRGNKLQGGIAMTPKERERVKAALLVHLQQKHVSIHDLAQQISAVGQKVDQKTLHRFLERRLQVDDSVMEAYRAFVDGPGSHPTPT